MLSLYVVTCLGSSLPIWQDLLLLMHAHNGPNVLVIGRKPYALSAKGTERQQSREMSVGRTHCHHSRWLEGIAGGFRSCATPRFEGG